MEPKSPVDNKTDNQRWYLKVQSYKRTHHKVKIYQLRFKNGWEMDKGKSFVGGKQCNNTWTVTSHALFYGNQGSLLRPSDGVIVVVGPFRIGGWRILSNGTHTGSISLSLTRRPNLGRVLLFSSFKKEWGSGVSVYDVEKLFYPL